jgi:hypothetical protein
MVRLIAIAGIFYLALHDKLPFATQTTADAVAGVTIAVLLVPTLRHFIE